jgi:hypothetical protein
MHRQARMPWLRRATGMARHGALGILSGSLTGAVVMLIANAQARRDQAGVLADSLGLGNGVIVAAILGATVGGCLALAGREAIVRAYGIVVGIAGAWALYALGRPHAWLLTVILTGAFGRAAAPYASLLAFLLLAAAFRLAAPLGRWAAEALLRRRD